MLHTGSVLHSTPAKWRCLFDFANGIVLDLQKARVHAGASNELSTQHATRML